MEVVTSPPGAPVLTLTRTTAQLGATGSSTSTAINVALSLALATSVFVPSEPLLDWHLVLEQGGPQLITATPAGGNGNPAIPGTLIVMSAKHNSKGIDQSMFMLGIATLVQVPLSVGKAGQFTGTMHVVSSYHDVTVDFHAWTPGTVTFTGLTSKGVALSDVVVMGSFNLSPMGGGTVTLVAPSKISTDGVLVQSRTVLSVTTLKLSFVPEPGALLLLGAGIAAMVAFASHRR
jgi:hypothetical protein